MAAPDDSFYHRARAELDEAVHLGLMEITGHDQHGLPRYRVTDVGRKAIAEYLQREGQQ